MSKRPWPVAITSARGVVEYRIRPRRGTVGGFILRIVERTYMNGAGDDTDGDEREAGGRGGFDDDRSEAETEWDTEHATRDGERDERRRITVDLADSNADTDAEPTSSPPPSTPDPDDRDPDSGPDPGPNAVRNWAVLLLGLAVVSFVTAAVTVSTGDDVLPVIGAIVVGVTFAAIAVVSVQRAPWLLEWLDAAWIEHRRYVWFSTGLFAFGIVLGFLLLLAGVNLFELVLELLEEELFPELEDEEFELTASFFIVNNSQPFLLSIVGALSVGVLTAAIMLFNGIIVGNVVGALVGETGIDYVIVGLVPHGVFELAALFIAAGVGFRLLYRFAERIIGYRDAFLTKPYLLRTTALVVFAWLMLVLAAFVEAYITPELLEMLFAERLEGLEDDAQTP
ncbi:stage II sporulation protein M [Natrialba sp. INN-245]|uniref:stage II sporulation protein M n=1 Tax=Natrialba sp. INN-245 TaxID=2690967 RepID=UPI0031B68F7A